MTDVFALQQPIRDGGIENVHFFNGRLLTAADFAREQMAQRQADARIGEVIGDGIAHGLDVTSKTITSEGADTTFPGVAISPGLAINRRGQTLRLQHEKQIQLSRIDTTSFAVSGCTFADCAPPASGTYVAGEGLYLLTIAPSEIALGRAKSNSMSNDNFACEIDRKAEAVQFRLLEIPTQLYDGMHTTEAGFRNAIAYRCFGEGVLDNWTTHLLGRRDRRDDLIRSMGAYGLTDQDVPIALLGFIGSNSLILLDGWAVRRPLSPPDPVSGSLASMIAPRRTAVGQAMFHQFQTQLAELVGIGPLPGGVTARSHFPFLPPVGILPHFTVEMARSFFGRMELRGPQHINSAQLEPLLRESLSAPAIKSQGEQILWLYAVAENRIAAERAKADDEVTDPYLVFATSNLAYRADARFNLHRWDYANLALSD